jgi:hypothetical protein
MMDFIEDVKVIESDIEIINNKCNKTQCSRVYDTIKAVIKLIFDIFKCFKPKNIYLNIICIIYLLQ